MTKTFRSLCMIFAVVMAAFSLTACSFFNRDNDEDDDYDDIEVILSVEDDPIIVRVEQSVTVSVLSPLGDIEWQIIDESIATVDDGVITGVSEGYTALAVIVGEYFTSRNISVIPALENPEEPGDEKDPPDETDKETVTFSVPSLTVEMGSTAPALATSSKGSKITYTSLDQSIAIVSDNGVVTGLNVGKTTVVAHSSTGAVAGIQVTVTEKYVPETVMLNRNSILVYVGDTAELKATTSKGSAVTWHSADTSVATVANGIITAKKAGKTTITATLPTGTSAECAVTVLNKPDSTAPQKDGYTLTWADEFNGSSLDTTKWGYQTGVRDFYNGVWSDAWFWGNGELQYYTEASKNVNVSGGSLNITAIKEDMGDGRTYSSGRIVTRDKFSQTYGYFEARMKTPTGDGMWPAFWMLPQPNGSWGSNNEYGGWPHSGEIDIMEAKGRLENKTDHTIHFSDANSGDHRYLGKSATVSGTTADWHVYALDWTPASLVWLVDGVEVCRYNNVAWSTVSSSNAAAPFDKPFYILLNLAVGGQYDNYATPGDGFKQATMQVDYIRVYQNNIYA